MKRFAILFLATICSGAPLYVLAQPYEPVGLPATWLPADVQASYPDDPADYLLPTIPGDPNAVIDLPEGLWTRPPALAWDDEAITSITCVWAYPAGTFQPTIHYDPNAARWSFTQDIQLGFHFLAFRARDMEGTSDPNHWNDFRVAYRGVRVNRKPVLR